MLGIELEQLPIITGSNGDKDGEDLINYVESYIGSGFVY